MSALSETAEKIVVEFEENLSADGKAAKTLESYVGDIRALLKWIETKGVAFDGKLKRFQISLQPSIYPL
jgi:integrase/recombinase XerD